MTTNAIDRKQRVIASDSRWSIDAGDMLFYVDDTGFDKIADRHFGSIICAGDAILIEEWRNWFLTPRLNTADLPRVERPTNAEPAKILLTVLLRPDVSILFTKGWSVSVDDHGIFAGSGAEYARKCYAVNGCAKRAVTTAATQDPATGGEVKFVEYATNRNNLSTKYASSKDALEQLKARGRVMNYMTKKDTPIASAQLGSTGMLAKLGGELPLSAPAGHQISPWSDAEKESLRRALVRIAELEEQEAANT
jgi:hypothetical protein